MSTGLIVRKATREDIEAFSDLPEKPTLKAWCGEIDGEIVALGGFARFHGRWIGFCSLKKEARKYKMTIARTAIRSLEEARRLGIRYIYADAQDDEPGSEKWLRRLGFEIDPRTPGIYRWRA